MLKWFPAALLSALACALVPAPAALADTSQSSNWAGYAIHRAGVSFTTVLGGWKQPNVKCPPGSPSYSALWVGLGGYSTTSDALEQIGTEVDCTRSGKVASSAWYELVPSASRTIAFTVHPGDQLRASVTVVGQTVTMLLNDLSRHRRFVKTLPTSDLDISSAEWIVEAPSSCFSAGSCITLPLANFGSARFDLASADSTTGHTGSIVNRAWDSTEISLAPAARHFIATRNLGVVSGSAAPSVLTPNGRSFTVTYHQASVPSSPTLAESQAAPREGQLVHLGPSLTR